ncbi:hypothetical protein DDE05_03515 [Streptomyces cavourensis]|jgi:hypothetical protein|nr:hypothetical protein DDE05_03515 [Streptomyces cavourensis]
MADQFIKRVLGNEYDEPLENALIEVLLFRGAVAIDASVCVGGSQELKEVKFELDGHLITLEAETYMGLSIIGPALLVDELVGIAMRSLDR